MMSRENRRKGNWMLKILGKMMAKQRYRETGTGRLLQRERHSIPGFLVTPLARNTLSGRKELSNKQRWNLIMHDQTLYLFLKPHNNRPYTGYASIFRPFTNNTSFCSLNGKCREEKTFDSYSNITSIPTQKGNKL